MNVRPLIGLVGTMFAVMSVEANDQVTSLLLSDVRGGFGMDYDTGTWVESLYLTGLAIGMTQAPWWSETLTPKWWALGALAAACATTTILPFAPNATAVLALRFAEGLAEGCILPLLMEVALAVLTPDIRLYGLCIYSLTVTFTPTIATTWAALWGDVLDWRYQLWASVPMSALPAVLIWYGMPEAKFEFERLKHYDWPGLCLAVVGLSALTSMLYHGDRLDWFNSRAICVLALVSAIAIPAFLANECFQRSPLLLLKMMKRRNWAWAIASLFFFVILTYGGSVVPVDFLVDVQGYRPLQAHLITLLVALGQFVMLPLVATVLNQPRVDARLVVFGGLVLIIAACLIDSQVTASWNREQFYLGQVLQMVGQAMVIMALLMMATNTVAMEEGPGASAIINTTRAVAEASAFWIIDLTLRWRGRLHSDRLVDQIGLNRFRTVQTNGLVPWRPAPLLPDGTPRTPTSLTTFATAVEAQVTTMTYADLYLVMAALAMTMIIILILVAVRTYPPRILFGSAQEQ